MANTLARVRNGEEYLSVRTARKTYLCESRHDSCARTINPGDQYVLAELPPGGEMGYLSWSRLPVCAPCGHTARPGVVEQLFPHELVTEWLIWSNHHKAWWGPNGNNYYRGIENAGRYALEDTGRWLSRGCGCCAAPEVLVPAPSADVLSDSRTLALYAVSAPKAATRKAGRTNTWFKPPVKAAAPAVPPVRIKTLATVGGVL